MSLTPAQVEDACELAVRLCEACYQMKRPAGLTAAEALAVMERECREAWLRTAEAAALYMKQVLDDTLRAKQVLQ